MVGGYLEFLGELVGPTRVQLARDVADKKLIPNYAEAKKIMTRIGPVAPACSADM